MRSDVPTRSRELAARASAGLTAAAEELGLEISWRGNSFDSPVAVEIDGHQTEVTIRLASNVTPAMARSLAILDRTDRVGVPLVIADRVSEEARRFFVERSINWLDLRGHLHLFTDGVRIDSNVTLPGGSAEGAADPIHGMSGIAVAYWLSENPDRAFSPTHSSPELGMAPSTLSVAFRHLADAGLATPERMGVQPELFWELASSWRPRRAWLRTAPRAADHTESDGRTTWVRAGDAVARQLGAPIVTNDEGPLELYASGPIDLTIALRRYGAADPATAAASLAVAPTRATILGARTIDDEWSVAPLLTVALDLATDRGRGSEIVRGWRGGSDHVWA